MVFVCRKYAKSLASYEPIKVRMRDKNVFWRRNTQAAACYSCLPDVQYKNKPYYHLDDVSGLPEHAVSLLALMPIQRFPAKRFATKTIVKTC